MATSRIEITFNEDLALNDVVNFRRKYDDGTITGDWQVVSETWKTLRTGPGQVTIGTPTATTGERSALNFIQSILADYGFTVMSVIQAEELNKVVITVNPFYTFDLLSLPNSNPESVDIEIFNFNAPGGFLLIDFIAFTSATTNPVCTHYKALVHTSVTALNMTSPQVINDNEANPIEIELPRGQGFIATVNDGDEQEASLGVLSLASPPILSANNISVTVNNSPSGATLIIGYLTNTNQFFQYSINGTDFQESNVFTGILDGAYTVYVRNNGCVVSTADNVVIDNEVGDMNPWFFVSRTMSIRFAKRETFGNCGPYPSEDNTLSHESYAKDDTLKYKERQLFQTCDVITTQFQTNYGTIEANVIKEDGDKDALIINQMTNNIGRKDALSAFKYNLGDGKTGVYFTSGQTYDYDTEIANGTYALNGALPEWGRIGNWINIGSSYLRIENIIFDEDLNADVLVFDEIYTGSVLEILIKAIFNRQNYEVYEFGINFGAYEDSIVEVEILCEDDNYDPIRYLSENILVKERHPETVQIDYYNLSNRNVFYSTGIKNRIRIPLLEKSAGHDDNSEEIRGDNASNLIESSVYDVDEFKFGLVTEGIYKKTLMAVSHKEVLIDGVSYIKNGSGEKEGPINQSNLYTLTVKMLRANRPFKGNVDYVEQEIIVDENAVNVPNLLTDEGGSFISYQ